MAVCAKRYAFMAENGFVRVNACMCVYSLPPMYGGAYADICMCQCIPLARTSRSPRYAQSAMVRSSIRFKMEMTLRYPLYMLVLYLSNLPSIVLRVGSGAGAFGGPSIPA